MFKSHMSSYDFMNGFDPKTYNEFLHDCKRIKKIPNSDIAVLKAIAKYLPRPFPPVEALVKETGFSRASVCKSVMRLRIYGFINPIGRSSKGRWGSVLYEVADCRVKDVRDQIRGRVGTYGELLNEGLLDHDKINQRSVDWFNEEYGGALPDIFPSLRSGKSSGDKKADKATKKNAAVAKACSPAAGPHEVQPPDLTSPTTGLHEVQNWTGEVQSLDDEVQSLDSEVQSLDLCSPMAGLVKSNHWTGEVQPLDPNRIREPFKSTVNVTVEGITVENNKQNKNSGFVFLEEVFPEEPLKTALEGEARWLDQTARFLKMYPRDVMQNRGEILAWFTRKDMPESEFLLLLSAAQYYRITFMRKKQEGVAESLIWPHKWLDGWKAYPHNIPVKEGKLTRKAMMIQKYSRYIATMFQNFSMSEDREDDMHNWRVISRLGQAGKAVAEKLGLKLNSKEFDNFAMDLSTVVNSDWFLKDEHICKWIDEVQSLDEMVPIVEKHFSISNKPIFDKPLQKRQPVAFKPFDEKVAAPWPWKEWLELPDEEDVRHQYALHITEGRDTNTEILPFTQFKEMWGE